MRTSSSSIFVLLLLLALAALLAFYFNRISLSIDSSSYAPRADITVGFYMPNSKIGETTWVGIVPADTSHTGGVDPDTAGLSYWYIKDLQSKQTTLTAPAKVGAYDLRIYSSEDMTIGMELAVVNFVVTTE